MKKIAALIAGTSLFIFSFMLIKYVNKSTTGATYSIGILQTASHPALDATRDGFIEALTEKLGTSVAYTIQNAQGSIVSAHAIAQQFHANANYDAFFTIATPAAQAMSAVEHTRPIILAAVTDPQALGLIHPTSNVCGVSDAINVKAEVEMITQLVPEARTVGILYSAGETNSITTARLMSQELIRLGLTPIDFVMHSEADVPAVVSLACRKADVLLAPTDNMIASSIQLITSLALQYHKPLIVSDNMLVHFDGVLAARGVDYVESGKQAGAIAYALIVEGKKPSELPILQPVTNTVYINQQRLMALGLTIPASLQESVHLI